MPYVNGDTIEISRGTAKKYPTFTKLAEARAKRDLGVPYLNTVGFNGNPKTWCLMQWLPLDAEDWLDFALKTDTGFDLTEGIDEGMAADIENEMTDEVTDGIADELTDDIYNFYDIAVKLYKELTRSDSKKAQSGLSELLG
jgi:hypothetical protein